MPELASSKNKAQLIGHGKPSAFTRGLNERGEYSPYVLDFLERALRIEPESRMSWLELESHAMFTLLDTNKPIRISEASSIHEEASAGMISVIAPFSDGSGEYEAQIPKTLHQKPTG